MLAIPRDWTFKNYLIPPDSKCYKNMRIIITRSYLFWPLNHNFSKSLKLNCQCSYKYVQSFWNWPSVFWIYREYLCGFWCWKCKYYNLYQNNLGCNHHQSCNEDSLKICGGLWKGSIIEGEEEGCLILTVDCRLDTDFVATFGVHNRPF